MELSKNYVSLSETLLYLKQQVIDSLNAARSLRISGTPEQIFNRIKSITTYHSDPPGVELLQQVNTLLNINGRNYWRQSGAGDCDCLSIFALAALWVAGYRKLRIVIAGRNRSAPSHIYIQVFSRGIYINFDLTENRINSIRNYPIKQHLKISL